MNDNRWAILLCKFSEDKSATLPLEHYKRLFTGQGAGSYNVTDYFSTMSHGKLDLTNSQVFGWFTIPIKDKAEYDSFNAKNAADPGIPDARDNLVGVCKQKALEQGVPLQNFAGIVICVNGYGDYFGFTGEMVAAFDSVQGLNMSAIPHEMGHGFGLQHSRQEGSEVDYKDPWDIMSVNTVFSQPHGEYGRVGPGINAANMHFLNWLDESRVLKMNNADFSTTIKLRPLHRRDLSGSLAADVLGTYLVEYRIKERWDTGFPRSAVFIHRRYDHHSYIVPCTSGNYDLVARDKFQTGDLNDPFSDYLNIEVVSIDDANKTATVNLAHRRPRHAPEISATVIGGVESDGGGGIIVNGHFHRIPPWDPVINILRDLSIYRATSNILDMSVRQAAQRSALNAIEKGISALNASSSPFRLPSIAMGRKYRKE